MPSLKGVIHIYVDPICKSADLVLGVSSFIEFRFQNNFRCLQRELVVGGEQLTVVGGGSTIWLLEVLTLRIAVEDRREG